MIAHFVSLNLWWRVIADTDWVCGRCGWVERTVSCEDCTQHTQRTLRKALPVDHSSSSNSQLAPDVFVDITTTLFITTTGIERSESVGTHFASCVIHRSVVWIVLHWMHSFVKNIISRVIDVYTAACCSAVDRLATGDTGDMESEKIGWIIISPVPCFIIGQRPPK